VPVKTFKLEAKNLALKMKQKNMGNSKEAKTFLCFRFEAKNLKRNEAKTKRNGSCFASFRFEAKKF
jgi:hypothetical protein